MKVILRTIAASGLFLGLVVFVSEARQSGPSADSALSDLTAGNERHVAKHYQHPNLTMDRQHELASGQHPHASVLACADSRVPPEIVFDQGLGDLFVVRVAGNVASDDVLGSLEYGA